MRVSFCPAAEPLRAPTMAIIGRERWPILPFA